MGKARDLACYNEFVLRDRVRYSHCWLLAHPRAWTKHRERLGTVVRILDTSSGIVIGVRWDGNQRPVTILPDHLDKWTYREQKVHHAGQ